MAFDTDAVEKIVREHIDSQPYAIDCSLCGDPLDHNSVVDDELDISMVIPPCSCLTERIKELEKEVETLHSVMPDPGKLV